MRRVERVCDRCLEGIPDGGSVIEVSAGDLRPRFPAPVDLCASCGEAWVAWLRQGHQAAPPRDSDAEAGQSGQPVRPTRQAAS